MSAAGGRIAVDLRALVGRPSGIGWFTLALVERLASRGASGFLGLAHDAPHGADRLAAAGVTIETQRAPLGVVWQQLLLPRRLARGDVELFWSPLNILPWRLPVPAVVTIHDLTPVLMPEAHRLRVRWSVLPFLERTVAGAALVVTDSQSSADDLRRLFPEHSDRMRVVAPGVDAAFRPAAPDRVAAIRRELGCPDGYWLNVGTLEPRKNLVTLLDVWESMRQDDPEVPPLVVAGGYGWGCRAVAGRLEALAPLGVSYLGHLERPRLVEVVQAASAFVYPSLYEGFGLPVAEAMACGVPTVASDRSSLPEVVGDAGLLVDPESPDELATALRRLAASPELSRELGARGVERARRFDWDRAAAEMERIFAEARRAG